MNGAADTSRVQTLRIRTPEGIVFSQHLAGPTPRFLAWLIDFSCQIALIKLVEMIVPLFMLVSPGLMQALILIAYFLIPMCYAMLFEWLWRGQTIGKRVLRLRVIDAHGMQLQPSQIVIRNVLRLVDMMPAMNMVGGLTCLASRHCQRLGDIVANTVVVRMPPELKPDVSQLISDKYNSFRDYPHLAARLRQLTTAEEAAIAVKALARRTTLDPEPRLALFHDIAEHFRDKVRFPDEIVRDLADEQYVQNVVDIIFRQRGSTETIKVAS